MRHVLDDQTYLDFTPKASLEVVKVYRAKYAWIDQCLDANPLIVWMVHEDFDKHEGTEGGLHHGDSVSCAAGASD
jgi:hypothetical protein